MIAALLQPGDRFQAGYSGEVFEASSLTLDESRAAIRALGSDGRVVDFLVTRTYQVTKH